MDKTAPRYDRQMGFFERVLFEDGRQWACAQANGRVLEIAIGTGRNLPFYSREIQLTGVEFSPEMLTLARQRADELGYPINLSLGDAQELEFDDESFDTVVITFALCTIPDDQGAVAEARRVLRGGGRLVLLEHVRSPETPVRAVQRLIAPLFVRFAADHLLRDPLDYLAAMGFKVEMAERLKWGLVERVIARKP